jgi:Uma2 family endonuclease
MIQVPPRTIVEVFESLPEGTLCQVLNNQLIMTPSPDFWHQDTVTEIAMQMRSFVKKNGLGNVVVAPVDVYLNRTNIFQPDILFIATNRLRVIQDGKINGAPDIVVEVLSPGTEQYDRKEKKAAYEQSDVKEYWIVDPVTRQAEGFFQEAEKFTPIPITNGVIVSNLLGLTIDF